MKREKGATESRELKMDMLDRFIIFQADKTLNYKVALGSEGARLFLLQNAFPDYETALVEAKKYAKELHLPIFLSQEINYSEKLVYKQGT